MIQDWNLVIFNNFIQSREKIIRNEIPDWSIEFKKWKPWSLWQNSGDHVLWIWQSRRTKNSVPSMELIFVLIYSCLIQVVINFSSCFTSVFIIIIYLIEMMLSLDIETIGYHIKGYIWSNIITHHTKSRIEKSNDNNVIDDVLF